MFKILMVAQRELLENIKTKGFWIGIFVFPLILTLAIVIPPLLEKAVDVRTYAVIDESGWLLREVDRNTAAKDLARVFETVRKRFKRLGAEADIPEILKPLAPQLAELDESLITPAAAFLVKGAENNDPEVGEAPVSLPTVLIQSLEEQKTGVTAWWDNISSDEAQDLSENVSKARFRRLKLEPGQTTQETLSKMLADEKLFAYFVIGPDPVKGAEGSAYVSENLGDESLQRWFRSEVTAHVHMLRLKQENIAPEKARWLTRPFRFEARKLGAEGKEEKVELVDEVLQMAPVAFVYLMWIAVMTISQMLLTNTIEEKSNRIIEVLLSSVSPVQLMAGKIVGIAGTGLTVVLTWMGTFYLATKYLPVLMGAQPGFDLSVIGTNPVFLFSFVVYFILGYLFYASILVGIGSVCNTLKEAQNLMTPVMITMMVPLIAMIPIAKDPGGALARVLSYIPPFTPFVMMNRAATTLSVWEYVITTALLVGSILGVLWMAAKVFRIGILLTGKPPKVTEIMKWVKAPVGSFPDKK